VLACSVPSIASGQAASISPASQAAVERAEKLRTVDRTRLSAAMRAQIDSGNARVLAPSGEATPLVAPPIEAVNAFSSSPASFIALPAGGVVVARTDTVGRIVDGQLRERLLARVGGAGSENAVVSDVPLEFLSTSESSAATQLWQPYLVHPDQLTYDPRGRRFIGEVAVGLRTVLGGSGRLEGKIGLMLLSDASIAPSAITFTAADLAPKRVRVETVMRSDAVVLRLHANGTPDQDVRYSLRLPSVLHFENPPSRVQGLGLERRKVLIGVAGAALTKPVTVTVGAGNADVVPRQVTLQPGAGGAEVTVTADALGAFLLTATAEGVFGAEARIEAKPPIRFLLAVLLGSLVCALYWHVFRRPRKGTAVRRFALSFLGGLLFAVVWIGLEINLTLLPVDGVIYSTIGVFAFAAVGGVTGSTFGNRVGSDAEKKNAPQGGGAS
jgi:hypothetical protein